MVAKLQFPVDTGSSTHAFGAVFQGWRGLRDLVVSGSSYVGQEEAFNLKLVVSIAKKLWRAVL